MLSLCVKFLVQIDTSQLIRTLREEHMHVCELCSGSIFQVWNPIAVKAGGFCQARDGLSYSYAFSLHSSQSLSYSVLTELYS